MSDKLGFILMFSFHPHLKKQNQSSFNVIENWKEFYSLNLSLLDLICFLPEQQFCNSIRQDFTLIYWSISRCVCVWVYVCDELYSIPYFLMKIYYPRAKNICRQFRRRYSIGCCFCCFFFRYTSLVAIKGIMNIVRNQ